MMSGFVHPAYLFGGLLIALPILIHLLNRYRYKRVRWAAMEFLLESNRRNRRRVLVEQLLLLLLRCLLIAGIVAIVARPLLGESLASLLASGRRTDHVVVLDDSYSMSEQQGSATVFAQGRRAVLELAQNLRRLPGRHLLTVLRTSQPEKPEVTAVAVDDNLLRRLESAVGSWNASYLAASPAVGIASAASLLEQSDSSAKVIHLVTDLRSKDWTERSELVGLLKQASDHGCLLQIVDAAGDADRALGRSNLAVEDARVASGIVAAGVPFTVEATVRNFSIQRASNVPVNLFMDGRPLPAQSLEAILPGETAKATFRVVVRDVGPHECRAELGQDILAPDNVRYLALNVPERVGVLIIDGDPQQADARFLALALAPGGGVRTGLEPVIRAPEALASLSLEDFNTIFLLNVPLLDPPTAALLLRFVERGGGLAVFLGEQTNVDRYNATIFGSKSSFFRGTLAPARDRRESADPKQPDLRLTNHPVFRVFAGERNPFIETVRIAKSFGFTPDPNADRPAKAILQGREGSPLAIETAVGEGRAIAFLTTLGPAWNTWVRNPSFVVAMLELQSYLSEPGLQPAESYVGQPWVASASVANYRRELKLSYPAPSAAGTGSSSNRQSETISAEVQGQLYQAAFPNTQTPGIYEAEWTRTDSAPRVLVRSYNVDTVESQLERIDRRGIEDRLPGVPFQLRTPADLSGERDEGGFEPRDVLVLAFLLLLVVEQLLAYRLSYHVKTSRRPAASLA